MKKMFMRTSAAAVLTILAVIIMMAMMQVTAHAAFNDRSADGAKAMPSNRTLTIAKGKVVKINFGTAYDYTNYYYFKIKPNATGVIAFTDDYTHGSNVALCNAKKKIISRGEKSYDDFYSAGSQYPYQKVLYYGVKKGKTYYIRVKGASAEYEAYGLPYVGNVKWTLSKVKASKYGTSKKKAKAMKKKKTVKGLFVAGNKKAQWFKITNKQKKTKITFLSKKNNGSFKVTVYYKSYGKWYNSTYRVYRSDSSNKNVLTGTVSKKVKHTYYLKVTPDAKTSGYYTLKWK